MQVGEAEGGEKKLNINGAVGDDSQHNFRRATREKWCCHAWEKRGKGLISLVKEEKEKRTVVMTSSQ